MTRRHFLAWTAAGAAALGAVQLFRPSGAVATLLGDAPVRRPRPDPLPDHHDPGGGFRNPWPTADTREEGGFMRWQRERRAQQLPPDPQPDQLPAAEPDIAYPRAPADELRVTWVGHATFLLQIGGVNILTDPHWSRRASPVQFAGPARFTPPGVPWEALPPIDAVLLSHDHYDHLDDGTVRRLRRSFGDTVRWYTPLDFAPWFAGRRVRNVMEMDWWEETRLEGPAGALRIAALPCQHWTSRTPWDRQQRLWASWAVWAPDGRSVYFGGDTGYFPGYPEIRDRVGTFDALLMPIGAYEPRWFMRPVHMNPEEAALVYQELGGTGTLFGMHWGTWRLTDEDPLEPPVRMRQVWKDLGMPDDDLQILPHGGSWIG
jgi:N-acyl-phosphatidylethanolamine-hydrolysing phospholipase D